MAQDNRHGEGETGAVPVDSRADGERPGADRPEGAADADTAQVNPWARPGSTAAAGQPDGDAASARGPGAQESGASGDGPSAAAGRQASGGGATDQQATDQHETGQHATDQHATDQQATDQHATDPHATDPHATDPHAIGQHTGGQHAVEQGASAHSAEHPTGPTAQYPTGYGPDQTVQYPYGGYPPYGQAGPYPGASHPVPGFGAAPYPGPPGGPYPGGPGQPSAPRRRNRLVALIAGGAVLALVAGGIGGAVGADIARSGGGVTGGGVLGEPLPGVDPEAATTPVEAVAARVLPSVVQLRVEGGTLSRGEQGEGSGMVVSADGLVLTNNHVVEPAAGGGTLRAVFSDGRTAPVRIIGRDPESDIAVVKADNVAGLPTIELGNSDGVRVGQAVVAVGAPLGLGGSVTNGIISALNRAVSVGGGESGPATSPTTVLSALQTDAAINPGNSGGPLVDMQGRVVGINSAIATAGPGGGSIGVGFSIPVNQAKRIADQLRTTGRATHAVLGVEVVDDPSQTGALVRTVDPAGPAAKAGLQPDNVVVRLANQPITGGTELQAAVRSQNPGATVEIRLADGSTRQVTLGEK